MVDGNLNVLSRSPLGPLFWKCRQLIMLFTIGQGDQGSILDRLIQIFTAKGAEWCPPIRAGSKVRERVQECNSNSERMASTCTSDWRISSAVSRRASARVLPTKSPRSTADLSSVVSAAIVADLSTLCVCTWDQIEVLIDKRILGQRYQLLH